MNISNDLDDICEKYEIKEAFRILDDVYSKKGKNQKNNILDFSKIVKDNALEYQLTHVFNMIRILSDPNNKAILDGSCTGSGKTFTTCMVCKEMNLKPFVICLKSNIRTWYDVLKKFEVEPFAVVNYELIRTCKYYENDSSDIVQTCPYIRKKENKHMDFEWLFDENQLKNIVFVFDEVHVCKKSTSINSKLLLSCKQYKTIMISATLCDKISDFGVFGVMLGYYKNTASGKKWLNNIIIKEKKRLDVNTDNILDGLDDKNSHNVLHKQIFYNGVQSKGCLMKQDIIGDTTNKNNQHNQHNQHNICIEVKDLKMTKEIREIYDDLAEYDILDDTISDNATITDNAILISDGDLVIKPKNMREMVRKREIIENLKVDIYLEYLRYYLNLNMSIVIFVNFRSTHKKICDILKNENIDHAIIHGNQTYIERNDNIQSFQNNEVRVLISMLQAGGASISLHDTSGKFPRVSIISPSYSVIEMVQVLGRIVRANTKTPTLQKIIFCQGTIEEHVAQKLKEKCEIMKIITNTPKSDFLTQGDDLDIGFSRKHKQNKQNK